MAQKIHDIFGPGSNSSGRIIQDYPEIARRAEACRSLGMRIVLTSGSFDLLHEGHARYLEAARDHGDLLIVGVDEDAKVQERKGENRPIVSERERMEILCHIRHVDLVFLKKLADPQWELIKVVCPDILIATQETYTDEQIEALRSHCKEIIVLPPQAATSTTARIRKLLIETLAKVRTEFDSAVDHVRQVLDTLQHGRK